MKVVARPDALEALREHGQVYVWPRTYRLRPSHVSSRGVVRNWSNQAWIG